MKKNLLRIALLFVTFTLSLSAFAADKEDVYTEGLKTLIKNGGATVINGDQFAKMSAAMGGSAEKLIDEMVEIMAPYYRDNMSEEEFKQMMAFYQKPEIVAIMKKMTDGSNDSQEQMMKSIMPQMMQVMQGGEIEPVKVEGCSEEFIKAFDRFYTLSNVEKSMEGVMSSLKQMFEGLKENIPEGQRDSFMKSMDRVISFMKENIKPITMMTLSKTLTVDELNTYCSITNEPFFPAMQKVNDAVAADMSAIMGKIMSKIQIPGM